ncbi:long-chain fatty acid--CoA ligase [Hydrogenophaga sp. D2P1]|uniref:Long-chain fatty acid--CoA ligase n=1 Tax=Hydrogenophaga aromaticivorans TaxID=2610898 RepID=A0A7Y8KZ65_9BURK|nr:AMP-binding protein [Hydrogenophaga aromaticivorans]NWF47011.1 long-chain fatty acid--CoA ligase [Hydrogenophaga aromaticivorans]
MAQLPTPVLPPARSLDSLLQRLARERPGALALSAREPAAPAGPDTDFAELARWAAAVARHLQTQHGVQAGDRVAWLGLNHPLQIVLLFALARLGALLVPLNHRLAAAEWAAVLADCQPRVLVHDTHFASAAQSLPHPSPAAGHLVPMAQLPGRLNTTTTDTMDPDGPEFAEAWDAPVLLVYTSGTTGAPKAAVHTQGNLLANMAIAAQVQGLSANDTVLTVLPLFHVGGLCLQTLPALSVGARVLLFSRFDAVATLDAIAHERPTLTLQVPATLKALTEHPRWTGTDLSSLRAVWAGSSLLPPAPLAAFHARGVPVCNVYGSTETGPFSIALPAEHAQDHAGSCGWPAPGVEVQLRDPLGAVVAPGAVGELCIRAPNVVRRYWPDRAACDADGFFHSGDLAQQAPDGSFTVVGRSKDMIISGGENIYPAEIENLLLQHPLVVECSVIGQADARWGEVAVAVLVLQPGEHDHPDWAEPLQRFLDGRLARYKWPRRWLRVDALPKTALGKVQKAELKRLLDAPAAE